MAKTYNLQNIRTLLSEGFTAGELRRFCYDNPKFRQVYDQLAEDTGKAIIVDRLLEYSERKELLDSLLTWTKEQNSSKYEKHQPYISHVAPHNPFSSGSEQPESIALRHEPNQVSVTDKPKSSPLLRVFLCHSSSDKLAVRNLYYRLKQEGFDPWLDEAKLLPGQDWEHEIRKAVQASDVVIVCLSKASVSKAGFVQKEIEYALDVADKQPEGTIFVIPLRLEECQVPERLRRWHWVNFFEENSYERLMHALQERAKALALTPKPSAQVKAASLPSFTLTKPHSIGSSTTWIRLRKLLFLVLVGFVVVVVLCTVAIWLSNSNRNPILAPFAKATLVVSDPILMPKNKILRPREQVAIAVDVATNSPPVVYSWSAEDGKIFDPGDNPIVYITPDTPGIYAIFLRVEAGGLVVEKYTTIQVASLSPTPTQTPTDTPVPLTNTPTGSPVLIPTPTPTFSPTTFPTPSSTREKLAGKLAFTSDRGGQGYRIFVTDLSNGDTIQVTDGANRDSLPVDDWDPSWSPDGDRLVFESGREGEFDIFTISLATKELHRLTTDSARNLVPVWSPNGDLVAFQSIRSANFEIYVMSSDGSNLRGLTNHEDPDLWPSWSPDGQQIIFESQRTENGKSGLYIMNVSSGDVRPLLADDWNNGQPTWSKSGKVAFYSDKDGNKEIYTINQDGTDLKRITFHEAEDWFPAWSPDGQWIVFTSSRDGNLEIYVIDLTGQYLQRVTNNVAQDRDAAWFGN